MPSPTVLVIQHVAAEGPNRIGTALTVAGLRIETVRVFAGDPVPTDLGAARGLVVMGGPQGVYESDRYPHLADEIRLLERAVAAGIPTLGIRLGSQLLAAALGAEVRSSGRQEIGWLPVTLHDDAARDPLFEGAPRTFVPLHWHGDVFSLPPGATALASSALTEHQAFRAGERAWGLLFHLEVDAAQVAKMAEAFAADLTAAGIDAPALVAASTAAADGAAALATQVFGRFATLVKT